MESRLLLRCCSVHLLRLLALFLPLLLIPLLHSLLLLPCMLHLMLLCSLALLPRLCLLLVPLLLRFYVLLAPPPLPRPCLLPAGGQRPPCVHQSLGAAEPVQQAVKVVGGVQQPAAKPSTNPRSGGKRLADASACTSAGRPCQLSHPAVQMWRAADGSTERSAHLQQRWMASMLLIPLSTEPRKLLSPRRHVNSAKGHTAGRPRSLRLTS